MAKCVERKKLRMSINTKKKYQIRDKIHDFWYFFAVNQVPRLCRVDPFITCTNCT